MRKLALLTSLAALAIALGAAPALGSVSVGHSGWSWGAPQPQGNTLHAIGFAGGTGYAAGDFGTLVKTTDNGFTWTGVTTGLGTRLTRLRVLDAANLVVGGGCVLRRSADGGVTFVRVLATASERTCPATIASFSFVSPQSGYVLFSDGSVQRTDDGGRSFARRAPVPATADAGASPAATPGDVWFTGTATGYAMSGGTIYKTTDGATTWVPVYTGGQHLNGLWFADATTGYAVGDSKTILKTGDTGSNWAPQTVAAAVPSADLTGISCSGANRCLAASRQGDQLLRTENGGTSWSSVVPATAKIFAAAFNTANAAAAVGQDGATAITANGGANWAPVGSSLGATFTRLRATSPQAVFATGDNGTLARTTDGGESWTRPGVATTDNVVDVAFPSDSVGYAVDAAGALHKTGDGGGHWSPVGTGGPGSVGVVATGVNSVLLIEPKGLYRSTDGQSFAPVGRRLVRTSAFTDADRTAAGLVFHGPRAIVASDLTGSSFKAIPLPGGSAARVRACDFVTQSLGYVLTADGRLWATSNAGRTWAERPGTGTAAGFDMAWGDARNGYMAVRGFGGDAHSGYLLRTSDAGHSWRPQLVAPAPIRDHGLVATGANTAFALAGGNMLFRTASGGDQGQQSVLRVGSNVARIGKGRVVTISGKLAPAIAGADIYVSFRAMNGRSWVTRLAPPTTKAGRFTLKRRLTRPTLIVAQWLGDADRNGDGSNLLSLPR